MRRLSDDEKPDIILSIGGYGLLLGGYQSRGGFRRDLENYFGGNRNNEMWGQMRRLYEMLAGNMIKVRGKILLIKLSSSSRGFKEAVPILFAGI